MTRTLVLMRHAKAEVLADLGDHARPLAPRGRKQSGSMGARLAEEAGPFDIALVSDSSRTRETFKLLAGTSPQYPTPRITPELYDATTRSALAALRRVDAGAARVIVVGHEPVMSSLAYLLHDTQDEATGELAFGIPTGTAVVIDVPVQWAELDRNTAHVRAVIRPGT